jgi:hypothetical protein
MQSSKNVLIVTASIIEFLGVCCDASMGREGALYLKLIYLYPWVFVGVAVLTSLGFF